MRVFSRLICKSVAYSFALNVFCAIIAIMTINKIINDSIWFFILLMLGIFMAPLYFIIQGNDHGKWQYDAMVLISGVAFAVISSLIMSKLYDDFTTMFYWNGLFVSQYVVLLSIVDLLMICLRNKR